MSTDIHVALIGHFLTRRQSIFICTQNFCVLSYTHPWNRTHDLPQSEVANYDTTEAVIYILSYTYSLSLLIWFTVCIPYLVWCGNFNLVQKINDQMLSHLWQNIIDVHLYQQEASNIGPTHAYFRIWEMLLFQHFIVTVR